MTSLTLVIGNKRYSSWSLRPWLAMRQAGIAFEEVVIPLYRSESKAALLQHSPAGKVPVLVHGGRTVWDSLAIMEYLAETFPAAGLWPQGRWRAPSRPKCTRALHPCAAACRWTCTSA